MTNPADYKHISILWAAPEHAGDLAKLHAPLFPQAWDAASFQQLLAHPGSTAFLARLGQPPKAELVGFILGQIAADEAEILTLGVRADRQRHGIAKRLVEALSRAAKNAEVRKLHLEVGASNAPALALYKKLGFQEAGRRKGYYERPGHAAEDAVALTLVLTN
jgi:[ribosomal protein S18]-alanine N-acetyltransferase